MEVGDAVRVTTEFGKYYTGRGSGTIEIAGMIGLITDVMGEGATVWLLLSNGMTVAIHHAHVWLEVLA